MAILLKYYYFCYINLLIFSLEILNTRFTNQSKRPISIGFIKISILIFITCFLKAL